MSKKHFIALAEVLREIQKSTGPVNENFTASVFGEGYFLGREAMFEQMRDALADFCQSQNANFMRGRWLGYIAGENGKSGGKVAA